MTVVSCGGRFESVVKPCWSEDPAARPDFSVVCANIENFRRSPIREDYYVRRQSDAGDNGRISEELYVDAYWPCVSVHRKRIIVTSCVLASMLSIPYSETGVLIPGLASECFVDISSTDRELMYRIRCMYIPAKLLHNTNSVAYCSRQRWQHAVWYYESYLDIRPMQWTIFSKLCKSASAAFSRQRHCNQYIFSNKQSKNNQGCSWQGGSRGPNLQTWPECPVKFS